MNVLSLFDGMSCGQLALQRCGITYENYFASEIDKNAIKVTQHNFPNTIQLGSVCDIKASDLPRIDLLIGGSPCQGFSFAGNQLNFDDPRSKLFFEYMRLLRECKPRFFLLENVKMKKEYQKVISDHLNLPSVLINSNLVSAQNRERLYWTNFDIKPIKNRHIYLLNVLEDAEINGVLVKKEDLHRGVIITSLVDGNCRIYDKQKRKEMLSCLFVIRGMLKSNCVLTNLKDYCFTPLPYGKYPDPFKNRLPFRKYTQNEICRLQTIPETYFDGTNISQTNIVKMIGNAWTVDVIAEIFSSIKNELEVL